MATQTVYYGHWKLALYTAGILVGTIDLTVGPQGPVDTADTTAFADGWKQGSSIDDLRTQFPNVTYHAN